MYSGIFPIKSFLTSIEPSGRSRTALSLKGKLSKNAINRQDFGLFYTANPDTIRKDSQCLKFDRLLICRKRKGTGLDGVGDIHQASAVSTSQYEDQKDSVHSPLPSTFLSYLVCWTYPCPCRSAGRCHHTARYHRQNHLLPRLVNKLSCVACGHQCC